MTVREWFRKDRAAMWRDADHPSRWVASEIDRVARLVCEANNLASGYHVAHEFELAWPLERGPWVLWLPSDMIRNARLEEARDALDHLLYLAWPEADRCKFDPVYYAWHYCQGALPQLSPHVAARFKGIAD